MAGENITFGLRAYGNLINNLMRICSVRRTITLDKVVRIGFPYLYNRLIGHDPVKSFAVNCEEAMAGWILLPTLPRRITSLDPRYHNYMQSCGRCHLWRRYKTCYNGSLTYS